MSLGSLWLRFRLKYAHGLRVAYWRDRVRPRILATPPVRGLDDRSCEIHVLTSRRDWLDLMWALKSFYHYSGRRYALCIHDDGTLSPAEQGTLRGHFPAARIIERRAADAAVLRALEPYPRSAEFRRTNVLSPKVFDFLHYLESPRMMVVDSDVLFFAEPTELVRRIDDPAYLKNSFNRDVGDACEVSAADAKRLLDVDLVPRFNSGLGLIHRDSLDLNFIERCLGIDSLRNGHFWRIEQSLFALCSSRWGVELLPREYDVHLTGEIGPSPSRHYVGAIRHLFYGEGIRHLQQDGFLDLPAAAGATVT